MSPLQLISYRDYNQINALDTILKTLRTTRADRYRSRVKTHNMKNDQESRCEFPVFFFFFLFFSFLNSQFLSKNKSKWETIASAIGKIPKKGLFLRTEDRKESPHGPGSMKRILIVTLLSFFPYFFLSYSSPRTAPVKLCTTIEQARRSHPIRDRKWEKSVSQRGGRFSRCIFPPLFFLTTLSQRLTLSCRTVRVVKTLRELSLWSEKQGKEPL